MAAAEQRFHARVQAAARGKAAVRLPFDPSAVWGEKTRHHVTGGINGMNVRGPLEQAGSAYFLALGPAWLRDCGVAPGDEVEVLLRPEGPQEDALAEDVARALAAEPPARDFFNSLATFHRKGYLTWIDATKRRPDERAARIQQMIELLKDRKKQRT